MIDGQQIATVSLRRFEVGRQSPLNPYFPAMRHRFTRRGPSGDWRRPKDHLQGDRKATPGADHQSLDVVPGDVFDRLATALYDRSVCLEQPKTQHPVSPRAKPTLARVRKSGPNQLVEHRVTEVYRKEMRNPLAVGGEFCVEMR